MKYRPDIDGLRALAVIPVVFYHTGFSLFRGGFVGVDIFFVISGYLITYIINEEIKQDRFSIIAFYERRVRRIFPALFTVIFFCTLVAAATMLPKGFEQFGQSVTAATLFVANIYFLTDSSYFAAAAETKPLLHTWSLSVEEQFYLFFPLLLLMIRRCCTSRWRPVLLSATVVSLLLSILGTVYFPTAAFYLIPTRAWELFVGALIALGFFPPLQKNIRNAASLAGLVLILWSMFFLSRHTPFPGWRALLPCTGAALIIHSGENGKSVAGRLLGNPVAVFIGLISYSLYLWHWPLMVFAGQILPGDHTKYHAVVIVLISFVLAVVSWRYIEQPFRKKGTPRQRRRLFAASATVMALFVGAGTAIDGTEGWPGRFGDKLVSLQCDLNTYNLGSCFLLENQHYSEWKGEECYLQPGHKTNALLWGDSFAAHYVPGIKELAHRINSSIVQYTAGGCAPVFDYDPVFRPQCKQFSAQVGHILTRYDIHTVIMAAGWKMALENGLSYDRIKQTVDLLRAEGIRVIMIGQSPRFNQSVEDIYNRARILGSLETEGTVPEEQQMINEKLRDIVGSGNFVDPSKLFCVEQRCRFKGKEGFYFWDDGHYTLVGSKLSAEYILSHISL